MGKQRERARAGTPPPPRKTRSQSPRRTDRYDITATPSKRQERLRVDRAPPKNRPTAGRCRFERSSSGCSRVGDRCAATLVERFRLFRCLPIPASPSASAQLQASAAMGRRARISLLPFSRHQAAALDESNRFLGAQVTGTRSTGNQRARGASGPGLSTKGTG